MCNVVGAVTEMGFRSNENTCGRLNPNYQG